MKQNQSRCSATLKNATLQGKLYGYREDMRRGKELNEDQKAAVAKY